MLLKFRGAGGIQSRLASPVIDPPVWRNTYQGGALDLPVNVALLALGAILARAPIFVNRPTPPPAPQIDVYPNIAVGHQSTQLAGEYIDPVRYKPVPPAPDIYPNLAVNAQTQRPAGTYIDPTTWKGWPTPDIYPNVSAKTETVPIPREPFYTVSWKSPPPQIDVFPNVAGLLVVPPRPPLLALNEPQIWKPLAPQIDVYPNLAAKTEVVPVTRTPLYTLTWKGRAPQIDLFPNLAALVQGAIGNVSVWQDLPAGKWTSVDLYPNVAVTVQPAVYKPPPYLELPPRWKAPVQIDLPPNIAVTQVTTPLTRAALFVTTPWKGWVAPDFYPNVAVNTPAAPVLIRSTPEPTYTSKWTIPIEYPPNIAVQFTAPVIAPAIDPWPVHWPMPPVSQAQLKKFIQQQRRMATRRARQIAQQVQYDQELKKDLRRALEGEIEIEEVAEQVKAVPLIRRQEIDWNEVRFLASRLMEKPLQAVERFKALQVDPEEEEISEIHELQSLYAQDFYERLEALRRLIRKKLN